MILLLADFSHCSSFQCISAKVDSICLSLSITGSRLCVCMCIQLCLYEAVYIFRTFVCCCCLNLFYVFLSRLTKPRISFALKLIAHGRTSNKIFFFFPYNTLSRQYESRSNEAKWSYRSKRTKEKRIQQRNWKTKHQRFLYYFCKNKRKI